MITILTPVWAATKKLLNNLNFPVTLSSVSKSIRGLTTPNSFPVTYRAVSRSIRGLTAGNNFPSNLSN